MKIILMIVVILFPLLSFAFNPPSSSGPELLKKMSVEEKVGQLLMVHFHGEEVNEAARVLIEELKIGAIIYYNWANGLTSPTQIRSLSEGLQNLAAKTPLALPLLIATDQEGGGVTRLTSGFTLFPGNRALGATGEFQLAELAARAMGEELRAVGINMNLAPVVDINSNPQNPIIGIRSFGETAQIVTECGRKALNGFKQAGIIATLKHFPGYGEVALDPHEHLPVVYKSKDELEQIELFPFAQLASSVEAIMTAHILVPALDEEQCATLSRPVLDYLRNNIGFQGVIVADSLVMQGVLKACESVDEASICALDAGCDLLILGGKLLDGEVAGFELKVEDVRRVHAAIVAAVKSGRITEERLNQAVEKVLTLKERYLFNRASDLEPADELAQICLSSYQDLAKTIAAKALHLKENQQGKIPPLRSQKVLIVAPNILEDALATSFRLKSTKEVRYSFFSAFSPSLQEMEAIEEEVKSADVLIICSYSSWKSPALLSFIDTLLAKKKPTIALVVRDPLDATFFSKADLTVTSFSPFHPSLEAISRLLCEKY